MRMVKAAVWAVGFAAMNLWACGSDDPAAAPGAPASCPADNPECKEIADEKSGALAADRRRCTACHDGPAGKMAGNVTNRSTESGIELYPPNLTNDAKTGIGGWSDDQLAAAMRTGLDKEGLNLCPQMKHFPTMSDFEAYSIVKYLRSLPAVANAVPRSVCPPLKTKEEQ
jgi:hypothetical protein